MVHYPDIYKLARALQTIPYSTAAVERTFSDMKNVKSLKRNRLSCETLEALVFIRQEIKK